MKLQVMPKRCRVPRDNLLGALEEEEIVLETQPELLNTILAEDEEGRRIKKQKREHYRLGRSDLYVADRGRAREKTSLVWMRVCCQ